MPKAADNVRKRKSVPVAEPKLRAEASRVAGDVATLDDDEQVEGRSFKTSVLYWVGVLEEMANNRFAARMGEPKSVVGRWRTLSILAEKDGLPVTQLAREALIERTALTRLLDGMEEQGLLKRVPRAEDRRTLCVFTTAAGRRAFARMLPVRREIFSDASKGMSKEELISLISQIRRLVANLAELERAGNA